VHFVVMLRTSDRSLKASLQSEAMLVRSPSRVDASFLALVGDIWICTNSIVLRGRLYVGRCRH